MATEEDVERVWQVMLYIQIEMIHAWAKDKKVKVVTTIENPGESNGFLKIEVSKLATTSMNNPVAAGSQQSRKSALSRQS